jgi:DNA mismatch endonuclease (patch repair protein)
MTHTNRKKQRRKPEPPPPPASSEAARKRMKSVRQRDTTPEIALRSAIHRKGLRFRIDVSLIEGLRRRADVAFHSARVAVFVDGCFWHGCPIHGTWPKSNAEFWREKIERNRQRDADTDHRLEETGWLVIRVWEHEDPSEAAENICQVVRDRRVELAAR